MDPKQFVTTIHVDTELKTIAVQTIQVGQPPGTADWQQYAFDSDEGLSILSSLERINTNTPALAT